MSAGRLAIAMAAVVLAACSSGHRTGSTTGATGRDKVSITGGVAQQPTYADVKQAIDQLYRDHPSITAFSAQDVQYNAITRAKVLEVCHKGGPETDAAALESARIAGCAPLIFYFYSYAQHSAAPDAYRVAEKLYWYAVTTIKGPVNAQHSLNALLNNWGVS